MYGTIARIRLKPGMEQAILKAAAAHELGVPGYIGEYIFRLDSGNNEYMLVALFADKQAYFANANSPEQDARYRELLTFMDGEPEWHDGEIIHSHITGIS